MVSKAKEMIRLAAPDFGSAELDAVAEVLSSGRLVQGAKVAEFERAVAARVGSAHGVCVSSGTAALHLALIAAGVGPGDEVIIPDFTFPATGNVVKLLGATPVLVDIDLSTFNMDWTRIEAKLTRKTKALMPVHLFGNPIEMDPILALAERRGLPVIEDAACALGASYRGRPCGTLGALGCFSFHPRKVITTGEGGMIVTDDASLAARLRALRNHGMAAEGETRFLEAGFNYRLTDFQAALGLAQLRRLDSIVSRRQGLAALYSRLLADFDGVSLMSVAPHAGPVWQSYVVLLGNGIDRDAVVAKLGREGIEAGIGTYALSVQPAFGAGRAPSNSATAFARSLSLPLHPGLSDADVMRVVETLAAALRR